MKIYPFLLAAVLIAAGSAATLHGQSQAPAPEAAPAENQEGRMTVTRMGEIITQLDPEVHQVRQGSWRFTIESTPVFVVTDETHNRMRIMVAIRPAVDMTADEVMRVMQANFDSALDARYAVAREVLWSAFIHPLRTLHDKQFITAIGQTVNLAHTYGTTYSSGLLTFGGGDSNALIRRELIDKLLKKGEDI